MSGIIYPIFSLKGCHSCIYTIAVLVTLIFVTNDTQEQRAHAQDLVGSEIQDIVDSIVSDFNTSNLDSQEQREKIIRRSMGSLMALRGPHVAVSLSAEDVRNLLTRQIRAELTQAEVQNALTFKDITVSMGPQEISVAVKFSSIDQGLDVKVEGRAGISVTIGTAAPARIDFLPKITSLAIDRVILPEEGFSRLLGEGPLRAGLNLMLSAVATNANAHLGPISLDVPPPAPATFDLAAAAANTPGLTVEPATFAAPSVSLGQAAILVDQTRLLALLDVNIAGMTPDADAEGGLQEVPESVTYGVFSAAFLQKWRGAFGEPVNAARLLLSTQWLADTIERAVADAGPSLTYSFDTGTQAFPGSTISLAERPSYSCASARDCRRDGCGRRSGECDRDCTRRLPDLPCPTLGNLGRMCESSWDDPVCLAEKTACNAAAEARVAECNIREEAALLDCQRLRAQEELGCNIGREFQNALAEVGDIGRVGGDARVVGAAHASGIVLEVASDLRSLNAVSSISASSVLDLSVAFQPLDVGHVLACPFPGKVFYTGRAEAPAQMLALRSAIDVDPGYGNDDVGAVRLRINLNAEDISLQFSPPPLRGLLEQNPQLAFTCSPVLSTAALGLSLIGESRVVIDEEALRRALGNDVMGLATGSYRYSPKETTMVISVPSMTMTIEGRNVTAAASLSENAVIFEISLP